MLRSFKLATAKTGQSILCIGRSKFYESIKAGLIPEPRKLGRTSLWPEIEFYVLAEAIIRGFDENQRHQL